MLPQMTLLGALLLGAPSQGFGSDEAMLKLFKILRDRGSISEAEYQQLAGMTAKEKAKDSAKPSAGAASESALSAMDKMEQRLKKGEERLAAIEHGGKGLPAAAHPPAKSGGAHPIAQSASMEQAHSSPSQTRVGVQPSTAKATTRRLVRRLLPNMYPE